MNLWPVALGFIAIGLVLVLRAWIAADDYKPTDGELE